MSTTSKRKASDRIDANESDLPPKNKSRVDVPNNFKFGTGQSFNFAIPSPAFALDETLSGVVGRPIRKAPDLDLVLYKSYFTPKGAKLVYEYLLSSLPWYRVKYKTRGVNITTPRYTTVFGKDDTSTPPSSSTYKKTPRLIPPFLSLLKTCMEEATSTTFNFVLVNFYSDGNDSITYHSDDESFLGPQPTIASVSLGGSRDFYLKHKTLKDRPVEKFILENGDVLVMQKKTQTSWLHSIPKRAKASPRINITFRKAINAAGTNNYYRYNVGDGPTFRWRDGQMVPITDDETSSGSGGDVSSQGGFYLAVSGVQT